MQSPSVACAIHPDFGAVFTCERCGAFGCEDCRGPSQPSLCQACVQRVEPVAALTARTLLQDSFRLLGQNASGVGILLAIYLLWASLPIAFPRLDNSRWVFLLLSCCFSSFGAGVFLSWTAAGLLQQPRSLSSSLGAGLVRVPHLLPMYALLAQFLDGAASWLIFLPAFVLVLWLCLAPALVVLDGLDAMEAVTRSFQLTRGHRLALLAVLAVGPVLQSVWLLLTPWMMFPELPLEVRAGLVSLVQALGSALHYCAVVLAWMRLTGRVPSSAEEGSTP